MSSTYSRPRRRYRHQYGHDARLRRCGSEKERKPDAHQGRGHRRLRHAARCARQFWRHSLLLFRGFSTAWKGKHEADGSDFAAALTTGVEAAYKAVMKPAEGTILTVSRLTAAAARDLAGENADIQYVLEQSISTARSALENTVNQNPVLKRPASWTRAAWASA